MTDDYSDMSNEELVDAMGVQFAKAAACFGSVAVALRLLDSGAVRVIGMSLPPKVVGEMLRTAAEAYEAQAGALTIN